MHYLCSGDTAYAASATPTCGQVITVLRESNGCDWTRVSREVGHVGALLQIPNLDLGVSRASTKDQTVRVELSACQSCWHRGGFRRLHRNNANGVIS